MNARLSPFAPIVRHAPPPEAIELLRRALLLSVPHARACSRLNNAGSPALWPSAVYHALARRVAYQLEDPPEGVPGIDEPPTPGTSLGVAIEQFMKARQGASAAYMARLAFAVAARARLADGVLLRRVNQELDTWVYRRLAEREAAGN